MNKRLIFGIAIFSIILLGIMPASYAGIGDDIANAVKDAIKDVLKDVWNSILGFAGEHIWLTIIILSIAMIFFGQKDINSMLNSVALAIIIGFVLKFWLTKSLNVGLELWIATILSVTKLFFSKWVKDKLPGYLKGAGKGAGKGVLKGIKGLIGLRKGGKLTDEEKKVADKMEKMNRIKYLLQSYEEALSKKDSPEKDAFVTELEAKIMEKLSEIKSLTQEQAQEGAAIWRRYKGLD